MNRVVVTGIGVVSPIGIGTKVFWTNLLSGQSAVGPIKQFNPAGFGCQIAAEVPAYKIGDYVPKSYRKATKVMARDIELAMAAADDAFKDAGLKSKAYVETPDFDVKRFGCNIGAGLISCELNELTAAMVMARSDGDPNRLDVHKWGHTGMNQLTPLWLLKYLPNMLACHVTIVHGLMGPSNTITCQEASGHLAIGEAFRTIQRGNAEIAICGGAESRINPMSMMRQALLKRLVEDGNDNPAGAVRPFDAEAAGTALGEGGGLLILEEYEHAKKRGAKIYAELVGFAASQDTYNIREPDPTGHSYGKAVENALKEAKLAANQIDLIVPYGFGLAKFDLAELNGLKKGLGDQVSKAAISPIKSQIGNLGAGACVDAVAAVMAVYENRVPPAINTRKPLDGWKLNVSQQARDMNVNASLSTVYSLGGQNAALVFRRAGS